MEILEAGRVIGSLTVEEKGLFYEIVCQITENREQVRRLYVQKGWQVEYLGIPDREGRLSLRMAKKHMPQGIDCALSTQQPRGQWLPWQGTLDGVVLHSAWLRNEEDGMVLALSAEDCLKFPAWAGLTEQAEVFAQPVELLHLNKEGSPLTQEIQTGGYRDETLDFGIADFELSAESDAADGGRESGSAAGNPVEGW